MYVASDNWGLKMDFVVHLSAALSHCDLVESLLGSEGSGMEVGW